MLKSFVILLQASLISINLNNVGICCTLLLKETSNSGHLRDSNTKENTNILRLETYSVES